VADSTLASRTKQYLGLGRPSPTDPAPTRPSTIRLLVVNGVCLGIGVLLTAFGWVQLGGWSFVAMVTNVAQILYHHWRPTQPRDRRGWCLDPNGSGNWLWWDGSGWAERPPELTAN
jgi:hypothetical protein